MDEKYLKENIGNPAQLERLYQADKRGFEQAFFNVYEEISTSETAEFWKVRLEYRPSGENRWIFDKRELLMVVMACIFTGMLIKIPAIFTLDLKAFFFYEKNAALVVFFGLSLYSFLTKEALQKRAMMISSAAFAVAAMYINLLPSVRESQSMNLAYLHLPLLFWCVYGLIYVEFDTKDQTKRINYLKYTGELAILSGLILIAGAIMAGVTIGLFRDRKSVV